MLNHLKRKNETTNLFKRISFFRKLFFSFKIGLRAERRIVRYNISPSFNVFPVLETRMALVTEVSKSSTVATVGFLRAFIISSNGYGSFYLECVEQSSCDRFNVSWGMQGEESFPNFTPIWDSVLKSYKFVTQERSNFSLYATMF